MPHDHVTPVEEPNAPAMIWEKRIAEMTVKTLGAFFVGVPVAIFVLTAWKLWALPGIIEANGKEAEAERARYHAEFKAEQERSDAALKAERERSDGRFNNLIPRLGDTRQDPRRLEDDLRENGNLTIENRLHIDMPEESGDGEN